MSLFETNGRVLNFWDKDLFTKMKEERSIADSILATDNVELKQYHLGRESMLKDLLDNKRN